MKQTTSTTTGTNMIAAVRVPLDESAARRWTDAALLQYLNEGVADIAAKTHCLQQTEDITLVANTLEYAPTKEYVKVIAVIINPASGSKWGLKMSNVSSLNEADSLVSASISPEYFYEFGGKIGIYPAYAAVTTETATAYMTIKPADIVAGGNVPTPNIFDNALKYYMTARAFLFDGRFAEASAYQSMYNQELGPYRQDFVDVDNETVDAVR